MKLLRPIALVAMSAALALCVVADHPAGAAVPQGLNTFADPVLKTATDSSGESKANPTVGALFSGDHHYCSGSVVHSPAGNLVLTAGHCVTDSDGNYRSDMTFAPGYYDGVAPYGMWQITGVFAADGWVDTSDPDLDFAFLTVTQPGNPSSLESLTGANQLGTSQGFDQDVTLTGYPSDSDAPVTCQNTITQSDTYQESIACPGFSDGTSGGPWVADLNPDTGTGTVIGAIGGYEQGGYSPDVSYSAYFDSDMQDLYNTATGAAS